MIFAKLLLIFCFSLIRIYNLPYFFITVQQFSFIINRFIQYCNTIIPPTMNDNSIQQKKRKPQQPISAMQTSKKKKRKINPFEELRMLQQNNNVDRTDWVAVNALKSKPLQVSICDHSKINQYHSHLSIQKYWRYIHLESIPNPLWLSIKRLSLIKSTVFIDIEIQGNLFARNFTKAIKRLQQTQSEKDIQQQDKCFSFLANVAKNPQNRGFWRKSSIVKDQLWLKMLCYDQQLAKQDQHKELKKKIQQNVESSSNDLVMDQQLYRRCLSLTLTQTQRKDNLYPLPKLPAYASYLNLSKLTQKSQEKKQQNKNNRLLCIDCQMVTTKNGFELARVTIINFAGQILYDEFYKPDEEIINYNTQFSGITQEILNPVTNKIQKDLFPILQSIINSDTILIGHSLQNDLNAMHLIYDKIIDTSVLFRRKNGTKMKLKTLSEKLLQRKIQGQTHCSQEDCLATLDILKLKLHYQNEQDDDQNIQYHFLRDLQKKEKKVLIVDYDIDKMRKYTSITFEKYSQNSHPLQISKIICQKLQTENNYNAIMSRIVKQQQQGWDQYYSQLDQCLEKIYDKLVPGTIVFFNFQINDTHRVVISDYEDQFHMKNRPFCIICSKN